MDLKRYQTLAEQNSIAKQQADDQVFIVQQYARHGETGSGADRRADAQHRLLPHRLAGHRPHRACAWSIREITCRRAARPVSRSSPQLQPITVIFSIPEDDLPDDHAAIERRHQASGHGVRPRQCQAACRGQCFGRGQSNRYHHRHRERARAVRQHRQRALSQPVRQCAAAGEDPAERRHGADRGDPARLARRHARQRPGHVCLSGQSTNNTVSVRQITVGPTYIAHGNQHDGRRFRTFGRRPRRDRRRRPSARRTSRQRQHASTANRSPRRQTSGRAEPAEKAAEAGGHTVRPAAAAASNRPTHGAADTLRSAQP